MTVRTFGALIVAAFGVAIGSALLSVVGLLPESAISGDLAWPWPITGPWALLANLGQLAIFSVATASMLRLYVRGGDDDWDLRLWPVAVAASLLALFPDPDVEVGRFSFSSGGLVAFALLVVVARQLALTTESPATRPRRHAFALRLGAVLLLLASFSYQPLHPLSSAFEGRESDANFDIGADGTGDRRALEFMLGNDGVGTMTVRSLQAVGRGVHDVQLQAHGAGFGAADSFDGFYRPVAVERIGRGDTFAGRMRFGTATCRGGSVSAVATVTGLDVSYETLGIARTQRLVIEPPARLRC